MDADKIPPLAEVDKEIFFSNTASLLEHVIKHVCEDEVQVEKYGSENWGGYIRKIAAAKKRVGEFKKKGLIKVAIDNSVIKVTFLDNSIRLLMADFNVRSVCNAYRSLLSEMLCTVCAEDTRETSLNQTEQLNSKHFKQEMQKQRRLHSHIFDQKPARNGGGGNVESRGVRAFFLDDRMIIVAKDYARNPDKTAYMLKTGFRKRPVIDENIYLASVISSEMTLKHSRGDKTKTFVDKYHGKAQDNA